ncbi:two-component system cell cycle sensor histidine kinase/response regulator CckA [Roseovarius sp. MBR-154]
MAFITVPGGRFQQVAQRLGPRRGLVMAAAVLFGGAAMLVADARAQGLLALIAAILLGCSAWIVLLRHRAAVRERDIVTQAKLMTEADLSSRLLTTSEGRILFANAAARRHLVRPGTGTLAGALRDSLANPAAILYRMESRAAAKGAAAEHIITRAGQLHLDVHRAGERLYLWRFDQIGQRGHRDADGHALPMLTVGRNNAVLYMNAAARDLVGERVRTLARICPDLPPRSGEIYPVATPDGPVDCLLVEREGLAGRREVYLLPGVAAPERVLDGWAFFESLPVPLLKLGRDGTITLSNGPARALLGVATATGLRLGDALEGLGRSIADWLDDAAVGRGTVHAEFLRVRRDDREVFVQVTLNRATDAGEVVLIAVMTDATELKSLEAQFVQSQKMQAIGQLAGGIAHDFNNLLTAISGHCDLLLLRHDQGDPDYADLVQINQNANRAAALINQLLAYSRKQTLQPQLLDLRDTLSDLTHLLNRLVGEKVSLTLSHDPGLSAIRADKRQLEQVMMNLVVNARDAMPKGGAIRIVTANLWLEQPLRRDRALVAPGRYVSVKVIDEGEGIAPDKRQKVFEPFFTTKRTGEGTGLGLSTAYGIVKQTGGFIFVDSAPGEGATFQLLFPAYAELQAGPPRYAPSAMPIGPASGVVLLVEDEAPVRAFASRALQMRGFSVLEAASAEDALEILADTALDVDVFVTDVVMPGMDGPTWVQQALMARPHVKVVFMSGYAEETFGEAQRQIANSVFLPKPFSLDELTQTVQRQCR